jgi:hypothetical protein
VLALSYRLVVEQIAKGGRSIHHEFTGSEAKPGAQPRLSHKVKLAEEELPDEIPRGLRALNASPPHVFYT